MPDIAISMNAITAMDLGADGKCGHGWLSQALETGAAD